MTLHLALMEHYQRPEVGCYATGVLGRFRCLQDHPNDPSRWCAGCQKEAAS